MIVPLPSRASKRASMIVPLPRHASRRISTTTSSNSSCPARKLWEKVPAPTEITSKRMSHVPPLRHPSPAPAVTAVASEHDRYYRQVAEALGGSTSLTEEILKAHYEKFKMPQVEKYKGEGDPAEHVQNYYDMMVVLHAPEETICKCFPITLAGSAKLWWNAKDKINE